MVIREESEMEFTVSSNLDQSGLEGAYNQIIQEIPIVNGEKILTLDRGTIEATKGIMARNQDGHLYVVLGEIENEKDQMNGWMTDSNLTFLYSPPTELPIPDAFLDRVVGIYSSTLFKLKKDIIKEVCRILKSGGVFNLLYFDQKEKVNPYYFEIKKEDYVRSQG